MLVSLRKRLVLGVLALTILLAGAFGLSMRVNGAPALQHHTNIQSIQKLGDDPNWYCPAPPRCL